MRIHVAAAVNNHDTLAACLLASPDIRSGALTVSTYEGFRSASAAYNSALRETDADVLVLVHQDVYLPAGFERQLASQIQMVMESDPQWGVLGVIGLNVSGEVQGETWSSGIGKLVGRRISGPERVVTLDEVILIVRTAANLRFDEDLPGFHLYGADIVQIAQAAGLHSYALHLPLVHHSRPLIQLDASYKRAYRYMQRKWQARLPIPNLVCTIEASSLPLWLKDAKIRWRSRGRLAREDGAQGDPSLIAQRLGFEA